MNSITQALQEKLSNLDLSINERMNATNCLIQIKRRVNPKDEDLYWLTKQLMKSYICGVSERRFLGYDNINIRKLETFYSDFNLQQKVSILNYTIRELKLNQYDDEADQLETELSRLEVSATWEKHQFTRPFKLLYHLTTFNIYSVIISLSVIPIAAIIFFLPFDSPLFHLFDVSYESISDNKFVNHISNCFMMFAGMDGISIKPTGLIGSSVILIGKTIFFVVVFNFFLDRFSKFFVK